MAAVVSGVSVSDDGNSKVAMSQQTQAMWLLAWLVNNISITMLNKYAFSRAGFDYPFVVR